MNDRKEAFVMYPTKMNFEALLAELGSFWNETTVYSVEMREMTTHETNMAYYLHESDALRDAEALWASFSQEERDYREISVHRGEIEYLEQSKTYRFLVLQKLFKAYKKIYVTQEFASTYRATRTELHKAEGLSENDAALLAKKEFQQQYIVQPEVKFGMFAGYHYAPELL